jgi:predicted secreted hydrolase
MRIAITTKLLYIMLALISCSPAYAREYLDVTRDYKLKFPTDLYYKKDYVVQWWYFTGHLFDESGREFGYELTFFVVDIQKRHYKSRFGVNRIYISHFAVSDISGNEFYFSDEEDAGACGFAGADDNGLKVWVVKNALEGTIGKMHLKASGKDDGIDLDLAPAKPLVLNGDKGYSRKSEESPFIASYYFSYTRLNTAGTLTIGNKVFHVKGESWFDREVSTRGPGEKQAGWDWFGIQLDDKRELMLYLLRNKDGSTDRYSSGTFVYPDGGYRSLSKDDFSIRVLARYRSQKTGAMYPSEWEINIPSEKLKLRITPLMEDQEVLAYNSTGNYYWEGTCKVEGNAKGRAYVEMTGY